jgi:hypothetical protein
LSKASAVPAHAQQAASKAIGANLRIRSSTRLWGIKLERD